MAAYVVDSKNALWLRQEQLKRWNISDANREKDTPRESDKSKIKFHDGCVFLAACSQKNMDTREAERLLHSGIDINIANVDGLTALHQVCFVSVENTTRPVVILRSGEEVVKGYKSV